MPTVTIRDWGSVYVSVACPLCTDGTRIARTALAWQEHMETSHSAVSGTWADTGIRGSSEALADYEIHVDRFPTECYGCGATFHTKALLVAHLLSVHSAS